MEFDGNYAAVRNQTLLRYVVSYPQLSPLILCQRFQNFMVVFYVKNIYHIIESANLNF